MKNLKKKNYNKIILNDVLFVVIFIFENTYYSHRADGMWTGRVVGYSFNCSLTESDRWTDNPRESEIVL